MQIRDIKKKDLSQVAFESQTNTAKFCKNCVHVNMHAKNDHLKLLWSWLGNHKLLKIKEEYDLSRSLQVKFHLVIITSSKVYLRQSIQRVD